MVNKVIQRNVKISSRKAQLVCDLIRNQPVAKALVILNSTDKKISPIIQKLLSSAIANATHNHAMNAEHLYVYKIFANQGQTLKRRLPRARGSADMIRHRQTHLEIHLSDNLNERALELEAIKAKKAKRTAGSKKSASSEVGEVKKAPAAKVAAAPATKAVKKPAAPVEPKPAKAKPKTTVKKEVKE